jgi:hypothetical protein
MKSISGALACAALSLSAGSALAATPFQNRHRFSRCHTGGRPGEDNLCRVERSDFRFPAATTISWFEVLWRPVESAQYVSIKYSERLAEAGIEPSVGSVDDSYDNALADTIKVSKGRGHPSPWTMEKRRNGGVRHPGMG